MSNVLASGPLAPALLQDILDAVRRGLTSTSATVKCTHNHDGGLWAEVKSVRPGTLGVQMRAFDEVVLVGFEPWPDLLVFTVTDSHDRIELVELLDSVFHGRVTLRVKNLFGLGAGRVVSVNVGVGAANQVSVKYRPLHSSAFAQLLGRVQTHEYEPYSYALPAHVLRPL